MTRELRIGETLISDDTDSYVIAEVGHNHQGSVETCKKLFDAAKYAGCNAVKLQKRHNKTLFTQDMLDSPYENENSYGPTYGSHREALEFDKDEYLEVQKHARGLGLHFFSTAFDFESCDFLAELDVPAFKMASGDIINTPLLKHVAKVGKPMIMSTGGAKMEDVQRAYEAVKPINPNFAILQCTAAYPCPPEEMNLGVITTFREAFPDIVIGLSDHQSGIAMSTVAYVLGARIVEKHFTLNRAMKGTDHKFSLEPIGMQKLVRDLRRARAALGDGIKAPLEKEKKPLFKMAKKLVAARDLPEGHTITRDDVAVKSPNDGLPPWHMDKIVGRVTGKALAADDNLDYEVTVEAAR